MDPEELRFRLLEMLQLHEATGTSAGLEDRAMDAELNVGLLDVQQQLEILESLGLVTIQRTFGPTFDASLTPQGRLALEQALRSQEPRRIGL